MSLLLSLAMMAVSMTAPADSIAYANTIEILSTDDEATIVAKAAHVVPSPQQYEALKREFIGFVHLGPNTFSRREWGTGEEDPQDFTLPSVDTDQWVSSMKAAGMTMVILTVKHHDGFVLWQSRYTDHGVMSSPFEDGKGDILRSLAESCAKYGMKLGVYLSPADLYQIENPEGLYGNGSPITMRTIPRPVPGRPMADDRTFTVAADDYNEYFMSQLFELLTEYGPIHEVWFDGAHPKSKGGQTYNNAAWVAMIRELAPEAVIFGRQDVRWCGNEAGDTRSSEWNVIPFAANPDTLQYFPDLTDADLGSRDKLTGARYLHYQQPEVDTSIREGWFYRDDDNQRSRTADEVFDIYERSVGGNATFLLNVPPGRDGRFAERDVAVLREVGRRIEATYGHDLLDGALGADTLVAADSPIVFGFTQPVTINRVVLQEPVDKLGERIEAVTIDAWLDGAWHQVGETTNVGYKRIVRFPATLADSLRVTVLASRLTPYLRTITAHFYKAGAPDLTIRQSGDGRVVIEPRGSDFAWKRTDHTGNSSATLAEGCEIRYTLDGSEPAISSPLYIDKLMVDYPTEVRAAAWTNGERGATAKMQTGYTTRSFSTDRAVGSAVDYDATTVAKVRCGDGVVTEWKKVGGRYPEIHGISYTPPTTSGEGLVDKAQLLTSKDGKKWQSVTTIEYGNIVNDPTTRSYRLDKPVRARFVKFVPLSTADGADEVAIAELTIF